MNFYVHNYIDDNFIIFCHIYNMEWKYSTKNSQSERFFLTFTCQLSGQNAQILNLNNFHHQTVGNSPQKATDKVRFLKYGWKLGFVEKK